MKLEKIIGARTVIEELADKDTIDGFFAYRMAKFIANTQSEQDFYIAEMRKILEKQSEKIDEDKITIPKEKVSEFNNAVDKLNNTDVDEPSIKFKLADLASGLKLSMKQMYPLLDFIDEG